MSEAPVCPCDGTAPPPVNPPGLGHVRPGVPDFRSVRRALLQRLPGETALAPLQLNGRSDLVLQVLEWWAYIADVIGVYDERSLNESLLRTAEGDASLRALVRILGYRPRPAVAGTSELGVLLGGPRPVTLPAGFAIDSKPPPGKSAQTWETTAPAILSQPDAVPAQAPTSLGAKAGHLHLAGTVGDLASGAFLILHDTAQDLATATLLRVGSVRTGRDAAGALYTEIKLAGSPALPAAPAAGHRLLRSRRSIGLWKYPTTTNLVSSPMDVEAVERDIRAGDAMVLTAPGSGLQPSLRIVTGTAETVWYANGNGASAPAAPTVAIGMPHSRLSYSVAGLSPAQWDAVRNQVRVLVDWAPAGTLRDAPVAAFDGTQPSLQAIAPAVFRVGAAQRVLIEDADGQGVTAIATVAAATPGLMQILSFPGRTPPFAAPLKAPLRVLHNVVTATQGKTVPREVLGSGDAMQAGQRFTLAKSPLTWLPAGDGVASTLRVSVNGIAWTEVANFLDQPPDAQVFATAEDDEGKTHVLFGDGVNGARLPSGADNVVATYRHGAGADMPPAGSLTAIAKPHPGVRALRHPAEGGGGADADSPAAIRQTAPRSVLTFGRAISADDYEVIAARAPGVARVRAVYGWNAAEQRASVMLYVGDTPAAVTAVRAALAASADPNRPVSVVAAKPVPMALLLLLRVRPERDAATVRAAVIAALTDPQTGLLGSARVRVNEGLYFSAVAAACLAVPGVESMPGALAVLARPDPVSGAAWVFAGGQAKLAVAEGEFFQLAPAYCLVFMEGPAGA